MPELKSKYCVYDETPILRFFYFTDDIPTLLIRSLMLIFVVLLTAIIPSLFENTFNIDGSGIGLLEDYSFFASLITIYLLLVGCKFFFDAIPDTFLGSDKQLKKGFGITGVIAFGNKKDYEKEYKEFISEQLDFVEGKSEKGRIGLFLTFLFLLILLVLMESLFLTGLWTLHKSYWTSSFVYGHIGSLIRNILIYLILGPHFLWRFFATIIISNNIMKKLTKDKVLQIVPISPDKAGGLRPLGDLALKLIYLSLTPIPFTLLVIYNEGLTIGVIIILIIYFLIIMMAFFFPLSSAHTAMKDSRDSDLAIITNSFNNTYRSLIKNLKRKEKYSKEEFNISTELEKNYELYEKASKMPIWPFNHEILVKFSTLVGLPILFIIIQQLIW